MKITNGNLHKINIFLFLIFFLFLENINAQQSWSPKGTVWVYEYNGDFMGYKTYDCISYIGDTTINNVSLKVMEIKRRKNLYSPGNELITSKEQIIRHEYMYQKENTIYLWREVKQIPLFKLDIAEGDKWQVKADQEACNNTKMTSSFEVIKKGVLDFNGKEVNSTSIQIKHSNEKNTITSTILENIGPASSFLTNKKTYSKDCGSSMQKTTVNSYLTCYYDPIRGYIGDCSPFNIKDEKRRQRVDNQLSIELFPNPAHDFINVNIPSDNNIQLQNAVLNIRNTLGQLVHSETVKNNRLSISTAEFALGIYIISIEFGDATIINQKFVKK